MDSFLQDLNKIFLIKKKKFVFEKEIIADKLILNNMLFLENLDLDRVLNDLRLVEFLVGYKFIKIKVGYKNFFIKNRYLFLILSVKYMLRGDGFSNFFDYFLFFESSVNFLLNILNKFRFLNIIKNYYISNKMVYFNSKINYTFLSFNNKKRYKKIGFADPDYFDNNLWIYVRFYFKKKYYSKIFFSFIESVKLRWNNEKA